MIMNDEPIAYFRPDDFDALHNELLDIIGTWMLHAKIDETNAASHREHQQDQKASEFSMRAFIRRDCATRLEHLRLKHLKV